MDEDFNLEAVMPLPDDDVLETLNGTRKYTYEDISPALWTKLLREETKYCPLKDLKGARPVATVVNDDEHNRIRKIDPAVIAAAGLADQNFFTYGCSFTGWVPRGWVEATTPKRKNHFNEKGGEIPAVEVETAYLVLAVDSSFRTLKARWKPNLSPEKDSWGRPKWFQYELANVSLSEPHADEELTKIIADHKSCHPGFVAYMMLHVLARALAETAAEHEKTAKDLRRRQHRISGYDDKIQYK